MGLAAGGLPATVQASDALKSDFGILTRSNRGTDLLVTRGIAAIRIASSSMILALGSVPELATANAEMGKIFVRQLRTRFQQFNEQYFGGRLPPYSVRVMSFR